MIEQKSRRQQCHGFFAFDQNRYFETVRWISGWAADTKVSESKFGDLNCRPALAPEVNNSENLYQQIPKIFTIILIACKV
jgi:hypothetical protein